MLSSFFHAIGSAVISLGMLLSGQQAVQQFGNTTPAGSVPAVFETYLASQQATGDTTMTLASGSLRDGTALSGYVCFTVDSNTSTLEYECGTVSGTSVTGILRGLDASTGTTTVASLVYAHRRGADVKITDYPALTIATNQLNGTQSIPNSVFYQSNFTPSFWSGAASNTLTTLGYVNSSVAAGCGNGSSVASGCVQLATSLQAASGTVTGSTGANLVLPSSISTSSNDVAGLHVVVTQNSGKINWNTIDLGNPFTISALVTNNGGEIVTASSTITATTSIAASSVTNGAFILNGVKYAFPASQGSSNQVIKNNGSGTLTWSNQAFSDLSSAWTTSQTQGSVTSSTTVLSVTIPANTLNSVTQINFYAQGSGTQGVVCNGAWAIGTGSATTSSPGTRIDGGGVEFMQGIIVATSSAAEIMQVQFNGNAGMETIAPYSNSSTLFLSFTVAGIGGTTACGLTGYSVKVLSS